MSLLGVQTNFPVQLFRLDTTLEAGRTSQAFSQGELVTGTVEYAIDRRFVPGVFVNHQWGEGRGSGSDEDVTTFAEAYGKTRLDGEHPEGPRRP